MNRQKTIFLLPISFLLDRAVQQLEPVTNNNEINLMKSLLVCDIKYFKQIHFIDSSTILYFLSGVAIEDEVCNLVILVFISGERRAYKLAEGIYFPPSKSLKAQDWLVLMMKQIGLLGLHF